MFMSAVAGGRLQRPLLSLLLCLTCAALCAAQVPPSSAVKAAAAETESVERPAALAEDTVEPAEGDAGERTRLNLLGEVDAESGEARRNENVRLTLIDNNVLKELLRRMGATATIVDRFVAEQSFFGLE